MKKKFILTLIFAAFIAKGFTQISPFWDVGKFSFEVIKNTDSWNVEFNMDIGIFYFVENNTNIYASLSPCRVGLEYTLVPKIVSIEIGVELNLITNFNPCFYCSVWLNSGVCFCSLYDAIVKK